MRRRRPWRRPGWGFEDFFRDFRDIEDMFEKMFRALPEEKFEEPLYYGFSIRVGPEGEPEIRTFGNIKPTITGGLKPGTREPFTDVIVNEEKGELVLTAELPGCRKEDVEVNAAESSIEIKAETEGRRYYKNIPLEVEIDAASMKASFNNGILEVKANLKRPSRKGVRINID